MGQYKDIQKYLKQYLHIKNQLRRIQEKIDDLEETLGVSGMKISDMPRAHTNVTQHPTEDIAIKLISLKESYQRKYSKALDKMRDIESTIDQIENEQLQDLLYYRYINGLTIETTAEEMDTSDRNIYYLQPKAWKAVAEVLDKDKLITQEFIDQNIIWKTKVNSLNFNKNNQKVRIFHGISG